MAAPSTQPDRWARARGWLPPSRALLAPGWAPSLSELLSSPPCPLPPSPGSLILSSWKPDSLFPLLSPLPPSLSRQRRLPLPWVGGGALATRVPACSSLWGSGPPLHPGGPLQLSLFSNYRLLECEEPGSQAWHGQVSVTLGKWLPSLDLVYSCQTMGEGVQLDDAPGISWTLTFPAFKIPGAPWHGAQATCGALFLPQALGPGPEETLFCSRTSGEGRGRRCPGAGPLVK